MGNLGEIIIFRTWVWSFTLSLKILIFPPAPTTTTNKAATNKTTTNKATKYVTTNKATTDKATKYVTSTPGMYRTDISQYIIFNINIGPISGVEYIHI